FMLEYGDKLSSLFQQPYSWEMRHRVEALVTELRSGKLELHEIDLAVNALNNVCFLIREGYAPPIAAQEFMKNSLLHSWGAFESYIKNRRTRPDTIGTPSQYGAHFEWVVKMVSEHKSAN